MEAADLVLVRSDLRDVVVALDLAKVGLDTQQMYLCVFVFRAFPNCTPGVPITNASILFCLMYPHTSIPSHTALSQVVFRRIQLNFVWAMLYNVVAIPFAAGCWFPWTHMLVPPQYAGGFTSNTSIDVHYPCPSM